MKVLLVDDQKIVRDSLRLTIPWSEFQYDEIYEAKDGEEALYLLKKKKMELLITDIKMPCMSGLELIEKAIQINPSMKIIIVTGYKDFEYAKKALKFGIDDFLLKPIDNQELKSALCKVGKAIGEEKKRTQLHRLSIVKERDCILKDLAQGNFLEYDRSTYVQDELFYHYFVVQIKVENLSEKKIEIDAMSKRLKEILNKLKAKYDIEVFDYSMQEKREVFISFRSFRDEKEQNLLMLKIAKDIQLYFSLQCSENLIMGISDIHHNMDEYQYAHKEAEQALEYRFFLETKNIIHYSSLSSRSVYLRKDIFPIIMKLIDAIKSNQDCTENLNELMEELDGISNIDYVKKLITNILVALHGVVAEKAIEASCSERLKSQIERVERVDSISKMYEELKKDVLETQNLIYGHGMYSKAVQDAVNYIDLHFSEKLTLNDVADFVGLSSSYLSRVIKKETSCNFVDILNRIRIEKASMLLSEEHMKIYEVAQSVGFENSAYFYQIFKKYKGMTPKEYINES